MSVDVQTEVVIQRPRAHVARFAADPDNATRWYRNITSVDWLTPRPARVGTRLAFVARFLGRTISYVYVVREVVDGERWVMGTTDGAFRMETTYEWSDEPGGATRMRLRNQGEPSGFSTIAAPLLVRSMRRANEADLARLRTLLGSER